MTTREITQTVTAHRQREGAGFIVRRPFPSAELDLADPFLLLDEFGPADYGPGRGQGCPDEGAARLGDAGGVVGDGQLAILGSGDAVRLRGEGSAAARVLLPGGVPLGEPVARYGPFVMNTEDELRQAFRDYQSGRMGEITRTARTGEPDA